MARKHQHEDHLNHEAWAIPYGDLVTLLLAFFVVMYAVSSVNEGKYRVMADAMSSAFGGAPRTITPIQLGETQLRGSSFDRPSMQTAAARTGPASVTPVSSVRVRQVLDLPTFGRPSRATDGTAGGAAAVAARATAALTAARESGKPPPQLNALGDKIQHALAEMVAQKLVTVRRGRTFLEVEIQSDILFASGAATPSPLATATVRKLAAVLRDAPNAVRVEGYTDDRPIRTAAFPSNWELSAARAASVVHVLAGEGVGEGRLAVVGFGEHQPIADNLSVTGRNANRRVLLVILAAPHGPDAMPDAMPDAGPVIAAASPPASPPTSPPPRRTGVTAAAASPAAADRTGRARRGRGGALYPAAASPAGAVAPPLTSTPGAG